MHETMEAAIRREKRLKKWNRAWKIRLIESMNPEWVDLFDEFWGAINEGPADVARRHVGRDRVEMQDGAWSQHKRSSRIRQLRWSGKVVLEDG